MSLTCFVFYCIASRMCRSAMVVPFANDCVAPSCHEVIEPCSVFRGIAFGNVPVSVPLAEGISCIHGMLPGELLAKVPVRRGFCQRRPLPIFIERAPQGSLFLLPLKRKRSPSSHSPDLSILAVLGPHLASVQFLRTLSVRARVSRAASTSRCSVRR